MEPPSLVTLATLFLLTQVAPALDQMVLTLPRVPRADEALVTAVSVGSIGRSRIEVTTADGQPLGTISSFGPATGRAGGTFLLPVPPGAVRNGQIDLRFTLISGGERRSPTADEVTGVRLSLPSN